MHRTSKYHPQAKASPDTGKGKMAPKAPEPDDSTRLSAADPASPADSLHQFPTDLVSPLPTDSDAMLAKFRSIVQDKITMASHKLSSDLVKSLKELGHRKNQ